MPEHPLIVLKFGGSVLLNESCLQAAVHEIYRWHREGWRVVAVVSALATRTDALEQSCRRLSPRPTPHARAAMLSLGEAESAALLGVYLDRIGLPASILSPAAIGLIARGDPLDADPVDLNTSPLRDALHSGAIAIVPGFTALDTHARPVTLGRGGSDTTALFLAHALNADRCRLIKDVDGLYTHDPSSQPTLARRYDTCSYEDALATDGSILHHKAIQVAQRHGLTFELTRLNGVRPTRIGDVPSIRTDRHDTPQRLRVGIAGAGTVGGGVIEHLLNLPELFEITHAACRKPTRQQELRDQGLDVSDNPWNCITNSDVVVELLGGTDVASELICEALLTGRDVVTANKSALALHDASFRRVTSHGGVSLLASASVGGAAPAIERTRGARITRVRGVLNGTVNHVLEQTRTGSTLAVAVRRAQELGLAEADPSRDLDGRDSLDKLIVLAQHTGLRGASRYVHRQEVHETHIPHNTDGSRLRHIAELDDRGARVRLEPVDSSSPFFDLEDEMNALLLTHADGSEEIARARGAGRWPTAESVLADLLELSRAHALRHQHIDTPDEATRQEVCCESV